jgi:hypothetical protein
MVENFDFPKKNQLTEVIRVSEGGMPQINVDNEVTTMMTNFFFRISFNLKKPNKFP